MTFKQHLERAMNYMNKQKKGVLVKGNIDVIAKFPNESTKLYQFLSQLLQSLGYYVTVKPATTGMNTVDLVGDADVVIAHSQGASRVAQWMTDKNFPHVKAVILLDPDSSYLGTWNSLHKKKVIFASGDPKLSADYTNATYVVKCNDNHFFTHSKLKLGSTIRMIIH